MYLMPWILVNLVHLAAIALINDNWHLVCVVYFRMQGNCRWAFFTPVGK